jgi:hypothetical protein
MESLMRQLKQRLLKQGDISPCLIGIIVAALLQRNELEFVFLGDKIAAAEVFCRCGPLKPTVRFMLGVTLSRKLDFGSRLPLNEDNCLDTP